MMKINEKAQLKIVAHAFKYAHNPILGVLVGSENQIEDVVPLYHSLVIPTLDVALAQVRS